jgi:hypothetical protein
MHIPAPKWRANVKQESAPVRGLPVIQSVIRLCCPGTYCQLTINEMDNSRYVVKDFVPAEATMQAP